MNAKENKERPEMLLLEHFCSEHRKKPYANECDIKDASQSRQEQAINDCKKIKMEPTEIYLNICVLCRTVNGVAHLLQCHRVTLFCGACS